MPTVESKRVVGLTEATCTRDNAEHKWYFAEPDGASGETNFIDYICELAEHHYPVAMGPVMFFIFAMTIATFAQLFESCIPKHVPHPPHTVFLFLLGMGFSAIGFSLDKSSDGDNLFSYYVKGFATVDPHVIFWILLPPLLFEDAANSHWHVLFRVLPNALLVAVPGVIINTLMTGYLISGLFSSDNNAALSIFVSLLLGSVLSATDPVAVIGTLHSLRAPDKLSSLIAGEALLNDGTAVVLFRIFFNVAKGLEEFEFGHALQRFLQLSFGGIGWGLFFSFGLHVALNVAKHRFMLQVMYVVVTIYSCFFLAEQAYVDVSGVLAVVTVGFYMSAVGKYRIDGDRAHEFHIIFSFLSTLANESLFVLAGIVAWRFTFATTDGDDFQPFNTHVHFLELLLLYFIIHLSRTVTIVLLWPLLVRAGYGLRPKEAVILVFGGLRGAVGLALAMLVDLDTEDPLAHGVRSRVAFHVSGITLLTLIVNGSAVGKLYKNINVYKHATYHDALFRRALQLSETETLKRAEELKKNWFFHNCYFDLVFAALPDLSDISSPESERDVDAIQAILSDTVRDIILRATRNPTVYEGRFFAKPRFHHHSNQKNFMCHGKIQPPKWENKLNDVVQKTVWAGEESLPLLTEEEKAKAKRASLAWRPSVKEAEVPKVTSGVNTEGSEVKLNANGLYYCGKALQAGHSTGLLADVRETEESTCTLLIGQCKACIDFQKNTVVRPNELNSFQRERARLHWKIVKKRVWEVVHIINLSRKDSRASTPPKRVSTSRRKASIAYDSVELGDGRMKRSTSEIIRGNILTDDESRAEVYQTILNATHARLDQMFEVRAIHVTSYKEFLSCLDRGDEAIAGELRPYGFLEKDENLRDLAKKSHREQMDKSLEVVWKCLLDHLSSRTHFLSAFSRFIPAILREALFGTESPLTLKWTRLKRNMEVVIAYILIHEQQLHEISLLNDFPQVRKSLKALTTKAKSDYLYGVEKESKDLFIIAEHLACMKTIILIKQEVLKEYVAHGVLKSEDFELINNNYLVPALRELNQFFPTPEHLTGFKTRWTMAKLSIRSPTFRRPSITSTLSTQTTDMSELDLKLDAASRTSTVQQSGAVNAANAAL